MPDKLDGTLKQLACISQSLNEASDLLSQRIAEVEAALAEYKLGVEAWVELRKEKELSGPDNDGRRYEMTCVELLGYGKYNSKWGLLIAGYYEETFEGEYDGQYFLRDAPRETRLAAVEKLPDLLMALTKEATTVAEEAAKKAEKARQLAAGLSKKARLTP